MRPQPSCLLALSARNNVRKASAAWRSRFSTTAHVLARTTRLFAPPVVKKPTVVEETKTAAKKRLVAADATTEVAPPKRPLDAFSLYLKERRAELRREGRLGTQDNVTYQKQLGAEWSALTDAEIAPYRRQAQALKDKYEVQLAEYLAAHPQRATSADTGISIAEAWQQFAASTPDLPKKLQSKPITHSDEAKSKLLDGKSTDASGKGKPQKKGKAQKKGISGKPKKPLTAYFLYTADKREAVKLENPDATFVGTLFTGQLGKLLGERWKALSEQDKEPYQKKAAKLKASYEKQLQQGSNEISEPITTEPSSAATLTKSKAKAKTSTKITKPAAAPATNSKNPRTAKDPHAPKKPLNSYFLYAAERRAEIVAAGEELSIGEMAKKIGAEWRAMGGAEKAPFLEEEKRSLAVYTKEIAAYKVCPQITMSIMGDYIGSWQRDPLPQNDGDEAVGLSKPQMHMTGIIPGAGMVSHVMGDENRNIVRESQDALTVSSGEDEGKLSWIVEDSPVARYT
ncbi:high mobility group box domain-containing protein [Fimicolochytrium jonesii]|uniref:high mobility group box domain-containing protein n=1 Tax=Fimicolochytrium jonesii TaxID=1396493 RepID=UPI0022FF2CED|nr:high mobility group box domain-containing protein [Fimicolochytrium jonesii]KAI8822062.1 high mobility group box domain-containing protein [Fimicolochytrium jonesii]